MLTMDSEGSLKGSGMAKICGGGGSICVHECEPCCPECSLKLTQAVSHRVVFVQIKPNVGCVLPTIVHVHNHHANVQLLRMHVSEQRGGKRAE